VGYAGAAGVTAAYVRRDPAADQAGLPGLWLFRLPATASLLRPSPREIIDFACIHVEHDATAPRVAIGDYELRSVLLIDLLASQIGDVDCLSSH
jgi:hypothetical protein